MNGQEIVGTEVNLISPRVKKRFGEYLIIFCFYFNHDYLLKFIVFYYCFKGTYNNKILGITNSMKNRYFRNHVLWYFFVFYPTLSHQIY